MRGIVKALSVFCLSLAFAGKAAYSQAQAGSGQAAANPAVSPGGEPVEICLAPASVQMATGKGDDAVQAVRETFVTFLSGPKLKVTPLTSRLTSQAREEAKLGHCHYVLFVTLTHKKNTGCGLFTRAASDAAGTAVWHIPGGGSAGSAAARTAATSAASTALRGVSSNVKAKDEMGLEYRLEAADRTAPVLSKAEKAKASADGEDLLTPLVEHAAGAIADTITRK